MEDYQILSKIGEMSENDAIKYIQAAQKSFTMLQVKNGCVVEKSLDSNPPQYPDNNFSS